MWRRAHANSDALATRSQSRNLKPTPHMSEPEAESDDDATAHAAAFQRDGFCVVPSLIPPAAAADARHRSAQLWTTRHAAAEWLMAAHQLNQPSPQAWIRDIALSPRVGRLVSALLGGRRPALLSSQLFVKPPNAVDGDDDGRVPWHQDGAAGAAGSIAVWLALGPSARATARCACCPAPHARPAPLAAAAAVRHFEEQIGAGAPHLDAPSRSSRPAAPASTDRGRRTAAGPTAAASTATCSC